MILWTILLALRRGHVLLPLLCTLQIIAEEEHQKALGVQKKEGT